MTTTTTKRRAEMGLSAAATAGGEASASLARSIANALRVYHDLSKFKLSAFVVSTAAAGYPRGTARWSCLVDSIVRRTVTRTRRTHAWRLIKEVGSS